MKIAAAFLVAILILSGCATTPPITADLQPVDSSLIKAIGYDDASRTLFVQLLSTMEVYTYRNVPGEIHESFMAADSKGRFYTDQIKGKYTGRRD